MAVLDIIHFIIVHTSVTVILLLFVGLTLDTFLGTRWRRGITERWNRFWYE